MKNLTWRCCDTWWTWKLCPRNRLSQLHDPWRCFKGHPVGNPLLLPHRWNFTVKGNNELSTWEIVGQSNRRE